LRGRQNAKEEAREEEKEGGRKRKGSIDPHQM
jgi:hypothetical protein